MKYYLIYQIRNKLTGMIYIGQHQTTDLNDGYMGSGPKIVYAIKKYGIENFEKTILFECSSEEEMNKKEAEIVDEAFIARDDVYNIELGGKGGWTHLSKSSKSKASKQRWQNMSKQQRRHSVKAAHEASKGRIHSANERQRISDGLKALYANDPSKKGMLGKTHSDESRQKMSKSHSGKNNNQYGKMWICNDETHESKPIPKTDPIPKGWRKGRFCKK